MAIALNNKLQFWSAQIRQGPAGEFCRWWFGELKEVLPARWRERLRHAMRRVTLKLEPGQLSLGVENNHTIDWLENFLLDQDVTRQRQQIGSLLDQQDVNEAPRFLVLDSGKVLRKELMFPLAASSNLQQVLTFEMDRQTPFRADDVYFAWRTLEADKDSGQIRVELIVAPRKQVDTALESLAERGLAANGVDVAEGAGTLGINLLPPDRRHRTMNPRARLNYGLAAAALVLLLVVMAQSLNLRASKVSEYEAAIAGVQDEARRVQRLREQMVESGKAASFLTRHRAASPMAIEVLANITQSLPDDTYLDRLIISPDSILIQGKSRNAQQLIEVVNKSRILENAEFRGSTRLDAASGLEIFEINADIVVGGDS